MILRILGFQIVPHLVGKYIINGDPYHSPNITFSTIRKTHVVRRETLDDVGMIHGSQDLCLRSQENHTREEGGGHKKTDWDVHGSENGTGNPLEKNIYWKIKMLHLN